MTRRFRIPFAAAALAFWLRARTDAEPSDGPAPPGPAVGAQTNSAATQPPAPVQVMADLREAQFQFGMGNLLDARAAYMRVLQADPSNRAALFGLGTSLLSAGFYGEAEAVLEHAMRLYPDDYTLRNNLAWMYATARDPRFRDGAKSAELARAALLQAPEDFHVWSTLAEAYYVSGHYRNALRAAEESVRVARTQLLGDALVEFERQLERCRLAAAAMSILE